MTTDDKEIQPQEELDEEAEEKKQQKQGCFILAGLFAVILLGVGSCFALTRGPDPAEESRTQAINEAQSQVRALETSYDAARRSAAAARGSWIEASFELYEIFEGWASRNVQNKYGNGNNALNVIDPKGVCDLAINGNTDAAVIQNRDALEMRRSLLALDVRFMTETDPDVRSACVRIQDAKSHEESQSERASKAKQELEAAERVLDDALLGKDDIEIKEIKKEEEKRQANDDLREEWNRYTSSLPEYDLETYTGWVNVCYHFRRMHKFIVLRGADADIVDIYDDMPTMHERASWCIEQRIPTRSAWEYMEAEEKESIADTAGMPCGKDCL